MITPNITIKHTGLVQPTRQDVINMMASHKCRYSLTTTFNNSISSKNCFTLNDEFLKRLNRQYVSRRNSKYMKGFCVFEKQQNQQPHFHYLIVDDDRSLKSISKLNQSIDKVINSMNNQKKSYRSKSISKKGIDLQEYYNIDNNNDYEKYITKTFAKTDSIQRSLNKIGILDHDKVLFGFTPEELRHYI